MDRKSPKPSTHETQEIAPGALLAASDPLGAKRALLDTWEKENRLVLAPAVRSAAHGLSVRILKHVRQEDVARTGFPLVKTTAMREPVYFDAASGVEQHYLLQESFTAHGKGTLLTGEIIDPLTIIYLPVEIYEHTDVARWIPGASLRTFEPSDLRLSPRLTKLARTLAYNENGASEMLLGRAGTSDTTYVIQDEMHGCSESFFRSGAVLGKDLTPDWYEKVPGQVALAGRLENEIKRENVRLAIAIFRR